MIYWNKGPITFQVQDYGRHFLVTATTTEIHRNDEEDGDFGIDIPLQRRSVTFKIGINRLVDPAHPDNAAHQALEYITTIVGPELRKREILFRRFL